MPDRVDGVRARQALRTVWEQAVRALDARALTAVALRHAADDLARRNRPIGLIGAGKAAISMSLGAADAVGPVAGVVVTKVEAADPPLGVSVLRGGHPLPNDRSV